MNPLQLMELHKDQFTPNDLLIYETIIKNPSRIIHLTTSTLAEECGVSQPALSRFVKGLGYKRYQDFRASLIAWLAQKNEQDALGTNHLGYFNLLYQLLKEAEQLLTGEYMQELSDYISRFDRVFTSGLAKSYHPAELFETLTRKHCQHIQAVRHDFLIELSDYMNETDLLIIFSVSAKHQIMQDAIRANSKIMLVTANPNHNYQDHVDKTVVLPFIMPDPETSSISPVLFDIFVELLVSYLAQNNFKKRVSTVI